MRAIPQVDLAEFRSKDSERKMAFVKKLGQAYEDVGFVTVKNHGITEEEIASLYSEVKTFFDLPVAVKKTI